jgi:anti-sigma regulatory factor (Ser/Thr protein kinase)
MRRGLPAHPSSVSRARRLVREHLTSTGHEHLLETAELVVSEMVTNAIVHTGTRVELAVSLDEAGLKVEVADSGAHLPMLSSYGAMSSTGRGLRLVDQLVDKWGVEARPGGKAIWFRLGRRAAPSEPVTAAEPAPRGEAEDHPASEDVVDVLLHNVPLLVHGAWQQHAKALLREYLLLGLDGDASQQIEAHACAMDALAVLEGQLRVPNVTEDPAELMASTVEPHASAELLRLGVPRGSLAHFDLLDRQLEAALAEADAGHLLTPPTQPEFAAFRRWVCAEIKGQAAGASPHAWTSPTDTTALRAAVTTEWDATPVGTATGAVVAADDTGRIIAASPGAASLLRYDSVGDLVGTRLIGIIPARFHQAHLAGFTLHLITGRKPLLEGTVVVPALCSDGSEVDVRLTITRAAVPGGGAVFVAELAAADEPQGHPPGPG